TTKQIAEEVSVLMPVIARKILLKFFQTTSLSQTQIFTIMTLSKKSPCQLNELSQRLQIAAPTVTGIVDRLEKSGYVKRTRDKGDRRVVNVDLTAKGKRIARKLKKTVKEKWEGILSKLLKKDQENYVSILRKIQRGMQ
ncbi:MAG: MarR family transcriptional regulator, partial [Candidatus Omnitrophica bacterium]|nr:MarR family transcriptional regulator [Candidatus Omnitrophota bacterium]